MKKILKKTFSTILTIVFTLSFSMVASADSPTQIYVGTPGTTTVTIPEESASGSVVFTLETDADPGDITFSKDSVVNAATVRFNVASNGDVTVVNSNDINFENGSTSYTLPVIAQEAGGVTITEDIVINLQDINDAPTIQTFNTIVRYEEQADNAIIFYTSGSTIFDEDASDSNLDISVTEISCTDNLSNDCSGLFNYSFESVGSGFSAEDRFIIRGPSFDYEDRGGVNFYDVTLQAQDLAGASTTDTLRINNANIGETDDVVSTTADGTYGIGDQILIDVNLLDNDLLYYLNQPRDGSFNPLPAVDPVLELDLDAGTAEAELTILPDDTFTGGSINLETGEDTGFAGTGPGSPVTFLRFLYTVMEGDSSSDLSYNGTDAIDMGTAILQHQDFNEDDFGTYYFETGPGEPIIPTDLPEPGTTGSLSFAKDIVIDGIRPFINNSTGAAIQTTHLEGDVIEFSLDFSEDLDLSGYDYDSTIDLDIGGTIVTAEDDFALTSGLAANQIGFTYTVLAGQLDTDGIDVVENSYTGGNIADLAGNDASVLTHSTFNLPNDLVGQATAPAPSSGGGGGSSSSGSGLGSNPFGGSNNQPEPTEEPVEEEPVVEEEPEQEEQVSQEEPVQEEQVPEEEPTPTPVVVTPTPQPQPEPTEEPVEEEPVVEEEPEQEEQVSEEPEDEAEISFNGSLTTGNSGNGSSSNRQEVQECEEYSASEAYTDSQSYNCDASEEFIEEGENAPTIQLNLPKDRQSQYNNDDIVIGGKVSDESIKRVEVIAISNGQTYSLGVADVDEGGKFLLRNVTNLPVNEDILVYGRDVESPTQSPDYGLAINTNIRLIDTELISFAEKPLERLYESNEEGVDYWTFVSTNVINNGGLQATVKSELNTNHKAFWQSVMFGSTAITGSNSDQTVLYAPDETIEQLKPFSKHTVTILAEKAGANSQPLVVQYYVIPTGFGAGVAILLLILLFGGWYLYNKKKQIHEKESMHTEQTELQQQQ